MMFTMGAKRFWKKSAIALIIGSYSFYRVETSPGERVTPEHSEDTHEYAPQDAVFFNGLHRVERATRRVPAGRWQHRGEVPAVELYQPYGQPSHRNRRQTRRRPTGAANLPRALPNSFRSSPKVAPAATGLADTTRSRSPGIWGVHPRNTSLSLRLTMLRVTALPTLRDTERPSRGLPCSLGKACTEKNLPL